MRVASAVRGAARCVLRSGLARAFALRPLATGVPCAAPRVGARLRAGRAHGGVQCACECVVQWLWRVMVLLCCCVECPCAACVVGGRSGACRALRARRCARRSGGHHLLSSPWAPWSGARGGRFPHGRAFFKSFSVGTVIILIG